MTRARTDRHRVRVRSCALILREQNILLIRMNAPTEPDPIWMPPGGEVYPGETLQEAVVREVDEETGLVVAPVRLSLHHEFISPPFHAIEFYWLCDWVSGEPALGVDPDRPGAGILTRISWIPLSDLSSHPVFPESLRTGMTRYRQREGSIELQRTDRREE